MPGQRLQGTDGVRGLVVPSNHPLAEGLDSRRAYIECGVLTEVFAEHYAFAASRWILENAPEDIISPDAIVIAWDPRDIDGRYYGAVTRAVVRAGGVALVTGILPTPVAAVYLAAVGAAGAIILTASHNPSDQNGIKIFLGPRAMKPLPGDDDVLSTRIWDTPWSEVDGAFELGECLDTASEARTVYSDYIRELSNSWLNKGELAAWDVVLDTARGAWSGLAGEIVKDFSPACLIETNRLGDGPVNEGGGVIALEGRETVRGGEERFIRSHAGLCRLFNVGRARAEELRAGNGFAVCAVFDADGDRAYTVVYDPFGDAALVLGGDEAVVLQARFLKLAGELPEDGLAVLTIESDAGAACALAELGLHLWHTPVGDKWLLLAAARNEGVFSLGGEESGHTVVPGRFSDANGRSLLLAVGDGLKSFFNTCAAICLLTEGLEPRSAYEMLAAPFSRGYKRTLYAHYVDRRRFVPDSETWEIARRALTEAAESLLGWAVPRWSPLEDDPGVLYMALDSPDGGPLAAIYVRNSGTERKTCVVLRGPRQWGDDLLAVGERVLRAILIPLKDEDDPAVRAEEALLIRLAERTSEIKAADEQIRKGAVRGGLASSDGDDLVLTELGYWYLEERKVT